MGAYRGPSPSRPVPSSPSLSLSSVPPSRPSRRAMSGISLDGTCLKISSIINPQPGPRDKHPGRADECSNDQHSLSCFSSSHSLDRGRVRKACASRALTAQTAYPVTSLRQEMRALGGTAIQPHQKHPHTCCGGTHPAGPHPGPRRGQERSSVAEARECLGAQGPGQEVRRRRFAETWGDRATCRATHNYGEPPSLSICLHRKTSQKPLTISVSCCCGCVFDPSADPRCGRLMSQGILSLSACM